MGVTIYSPIKINLVLKVFSRGEGGYHEIYSLFWQKSAAEKLTIRKKYDEIIGDSLNVTGMKIEGENLVTRALAAARRRREIPPLDMTLEKFFPAGSGIGAGSGNAAALIKWLKSSEGAALGEEEIAKLGADVAFLASDYEMAEARGIGERLVPFAKNFDLRWLLIFPKWRSGTKEAYAKLDAMREARGAKAEDPQEAEGRAMRSVCALARGERAGLMPNDFYEVSSAEHGEYAEAEKKAEASGARGWGLCGSGSAFFALYATAEEAREAERSFACAEWTHKTYILE